MKEYPTRWHHIHYEHVVNAVVIGALCEKGPGCSPNHSHIIVYDPLPKENPDANA
jgi:hypothetical protein